MLALRVALLRCVASVCLFEWSGASVRGRADCAKKTASGLREGRASYRLRAKAPLHTPTQPACRTPSKECTNINTVQTLAIWRDHQCTTAPIPELPCVLASMSCPSFLHTRNSPSSRAACVWHGDLSHRHGTQSTSKTSMPACRHAGDPSAQRTQRNSSVGC